MCGSIAIRRFGRFPEGRAEMRVFTTLRQARLQEVGAAAIQSDKDGYDGDLSMESRHPPLLQEIITLL